MRLIIFLIYFIPSTVTVYRKPASNPKTITLSESTSLTTSILDLEVSTLAKTWILGGTDSADFIIEVNTIFTHIAVLKLKVPLDYETKTQKSITINAKGTSTEDILTLIIQVKNEFDVPPVFTATSYSCEFTEDSAIVPCNKPTVTDAEVASSNDEIYCDISGSNSHYFSVSNLCHISLKNTIDRDAPGEIHSFPGLILKARDKGNNEVTATASVTILDKNDNNPDCGVTSVSKTISETFTGALITLQCSDKDSGPNGELTFSMSPLITGMSLLAQGTTITISVTTAIDYDTNPLTKHKSFILKVEDKGSTPNKIEIPFSITISNSFDIAPVFSGTYTCTIVEESTDTCNTYSVTDKEVGYNPSDLIQCTLSGANSQYMKVTTPGCVVQPQSPIDRDAPGAITSFPDLTLIAKDKGGNTDTVKLSITISDINDNSPDCGSTSVSVTQNENTKGQVKTLSCTDKDAGVNGELECSGTDTTRFTFTMAGGSCVVENKIALDFETLTTNPIPIEVKVKDKGTTPKVTIVTIFLTVVGIEDNVVAWGTWLPAWTSATETLLSIAENSLMNTPLFTATANDGDKGIGGTITYTIKDAKGDNGDDLTGGFTIDASAKVTILNPNLDREKYHKITITVSATDGTTTINRVTVIALTDVNEHKPIFVPSTGTYSKVMVENTVANTEVQAITASDPDATGTTITCSITSGNDQSVFKMDTTLTKVILNKKLVIDKPTSLPSYYILTLQCKDTTLVSTAKVVVNVPASSNDYDPTVSPNIAQSFTFQEDQDLGELATFAVDDKDAGAPGETECSLTVPSSMFEVVDCKKLNLIKKFDYETDQTHKVKIKVADKGSPIRSVTATVDITVNNINDNLPVCTESSHTINILERAAPTAADGEVLYTVPCFDSDEPAAINNLAITAGNLGNVFIIKSGNSFNLIGALDYETLSSYTVKLVYTEQMNPKRTAEMTIFIQVIPVNEVKPTFTNSDVTIPETQAVNSNVGAPFTAVDSDKGGHGIVSYTLTNHNDKFAISNSGQVRLIQQIDYETMGASKFFNLVITAKDGGNEIGTGTLTVSVTDANDNAPVCIQSIYTSNIAENALANTNLNGGKIIASDADATLPNGQVKYTIASGDTSSNFKIDSATGQVSLATTLDYEVTRKYTLLIEARDGNGVGINSATCTLSVLVTDVNEYTPLFPLTSTSVTIKEDTTVGLKVFGLSATDNDTLQIITYSINPTTDFSIDQTGQIFLQKVQDFESGIATRTLTITATDNGSPKKKSSYSLTVNIQDVNEFVPTCEATSLSGTVLENANVDQVVATLLCSDNDATKSLTYYTATSPFQMVNNILKLGSNGVLDYESSTKSYSVKVEVRDSIIQPPKTSTVFVVVNVAPFNEHAPVFTTSASSFDVSENENSGFLITTITATDQDQGSNHGTIKYIIESGNNDGLFQLDISSGKLILNKPLNYELKKTHNLVIKATDGEKSASPPHSVTINVIDYNDNQPIASPNPMVQEVLENVGVDFVVKNLASHVTDEDSTVNAEYTITIVNGNIKDYFKVVDKEIKVKNSPLSALNDPIVTLNLKIEDKGSPSLQSSLTLTIIVKDVNMHVPTFTVGTNSISLSEDQAVGTKIYTASAKDDDGASLPTGQIIYSLNPASNNDTTFTIDTASGEVRIFKALDRESLPFFNLIIHIEDKGTDIKSNSMTLKIAITDVNDNDPIFLSSNEFVKSIFENEGSNYQVTTVKAIDRDDNDNAKLTYEIVSQTNGEFFEIDSVSGILKTKKNIDRETYDTFSLRIKVQDAGTVSRSSLKDWKIIILDRNDNKPQFFGTGPILVSISENNNIGSLITSVPATDKDIGAAGLISYSLISANAVTNVGHFDISNTGAVSIKSKLDRENINEYQFYVEAKDGGPGILSSSILVKLTVLDENDNPPVLQGSPVRFTVPENSKVDTLVGTLTAKDNDIGINAEVKFAAIVDGNIGNAFKIDPDSGQLRVATANINYESIKKYILKIELIDKGTPSLSNNGIVEVSVTDVNDNICKFGSNNYITSLKENLPIGTEVFTFSATDEDTGLNDVISYKLGQNIFGDGLVHFEINSANGKLTTKTKLDRESTPKFVFSILCNDATANAQTGTTTFTLEITDVNDNKPETTGDYSNVLVNENVPIGYTIVRVIATDKDIGLSAKLNYNINSTYLNGKRANELFFVHLTTGMITANVTLDRETDPDPISFYVIITDSTNPTLTSSVAVNITIKDVNDNIPKASSSFYSMEVAYNISNGYTFGKIIASDPDAGDNGTLSFGWTNSVPYFDVNPTSGGISRKTSIAVSPAVTFIHKLTVADKGTPSLSTDVTVRIDTFDPAKYALSITLTVDNFESMLPLILSLLAQTLRNTGKYLTAKVGYMYTKNSNTESSAKSAANVDGNRFTRSILNTETEAYYYAVANNDAEKNSTVQNPKTFIPNSELLKLWRKDISGTPTSILLSSTFGNISINKVQSYVVPQPITEQWYEKPEYIALIVICVVLFLVALVIAIVCGIKKARPSRIQDPNQVRRNNTPRPNKPDSNVIGRPRNNPIYKDNNPYGV